MSTYCSKRREGDRRFLNDRTVGDDSQPPAPEESRDCDQLVDTHNDNYRNVNNLVQELHLDGEGVRRKSADRRLPPPPPAQEPTLGLTGRPRRMWLLTSLYRFCTPGKPGIRLPLQGSVDAPDITHAWGLHPGSRDPN